MPLSRKIVIIFTCFFAGILTGICGDMVLGANPDHVDIIGSIVTSPFTITFFSEAVPIDSMAAFFSIYGLFFWPLIILLGIIWFKGPGGLILPFVIYVVITLGFFGNIFKYKLFMSM